MKKDKTTRREFLKASLMIGARLSLPISMVKAKSGLTDDQRIIVVGAGLAG